MSELNLGKLAGASSSMTFDGEPAFSMDEHRDDWQRVLDVAWYVTAMANDKRTPECRLPRVSRITLRVS